MVIGNASLNRARVQGLEWGIATAAGISEAHGATARPRSRQDLHPRLSLSARRWARDVREVTGATPSYRRAVLGWARLQPDGPTTWNRAALDRCDAALDNWLDAGLRPNLSLFYSALPSWLEERDGWLSRETALRFADYAAEIGRRFGDRVHRWTTFTDMMTPSLASHVAGMYPPAPGRGKDGLPAVHHVLLGHGLAIRAMRAVGVPGTIGGDVPLVAAYTATDDPWDRIAVERLESWALRLFLDPLLLGAHMEDCAPVLEAAGCVRPGDAEAIAEPADYLGLYWHGPVRGAAPENLARVLPPMACFGPLNEANRLLARLGFTTVPFDGVATTPGGWPVLPEALADGLSVVHELYGDRLPPVYITDSGTGDLGGSGADVLTDRRRRMLAARLGWLSGVIAAGLDVRGYEYLSVMDDLKWKRHYMRIYGVAVPSGRPPALPPPPRDWVKAVASEEPGPALEAAGTAHLHGFPRAL